MASSTPRRRRAIEGCGYNDVCPKVNGLQTIKMLVEAVTLRRRLVHSTKTSNLQCWRLHRRENVKGALLVRSLAESFTYHKMLGVKSTNLRQRGVHSTNRDAAVTILYLAKIKRH